MPARTGGRRLLRWIVGAVIGVVVLVVGGAFVYIHFIEKPAPAALQVLAPSQSAAPAVGGALTVSQVDGKWAVGSGSQAGYRVKEVLAGQNNIAVGRGSGVTGSLRISGTSVTAASFVVNLTTVTSDSGQRDAQFNGRIMDTAQFPTATFTLTKPIALGSLPKANQIVSLNAVGTLTMHGVTKPVTATLQAQDSGSTLVVAGQIPVVFANWNIANPSFSGFVTTKNNGIVEVRLVTKRS
jgi:polyisoprenoid-binding protein YceI